MALENQLKARDRELERIENLCQHVDLKVDTFDKENIVKIINDLDGYKEKADKLNAEIVKLLDKDVESQKSNSEAYTTVYLLATKARTKLEKAKEGLCSIWARIIWALDIWTHSNWPR